MDKSLYTQLNPKSIEQQSMDIIGTELAHLSLPTRLEPVIKRVIHTTADFDYARLIEAHPEFYEGFLQAKAKALNVYADTNMIVAGVSKPALNAANMHINCFVHSSDVVAEAKAQGITRSICGVNKACADNSYGIFVFGNAPTALVRLCELYKQGLVNPYLVIGVPVGFVGAAESKAMLKASGMPYIISRGRKGGSTVAVAILNALLYSHITAAN